MRLDGSCHCRKVSFSLESAHPYPFNLCYCSICRKTAGSGGYGINLGGDFGSLQVKGKENIGIYQAKQVDPKSGEEFSSPARRHFCKHCGSALWVWDPRWPELVHPFASAIDTALPMPPERTHLMLGSRAPWVSPCVNESDKQFDEYPKESIAQWHERLGLTK